MGLRRWFGALASKSLFRRKTEQKRAPIGESIKNALGLKKTEPEKSSIRNVEFQRTSPETPRFERFRRIKGAKREEELQHPEFPFSEIKRGKKTIGINVRNPHTGEIDTYQVVRDRNGNPLVKVQYPGENRPRFLTYPQFAEAITPKKRVA